MLFVPELEVWRPHEEILLGPRSIASVWSTSRWQPQIHEGLEHVGADRLQHGHAFYDLWRRIHDLLGIVRKTRTSQIELKLFALVGRQLGMTEEQLAKIRDCARALSGDQKTVRITCKDGDVLEGFALFVSDAERDVIFDLRSSNNPEKYEQGTVYSVQWDDIEDFELLL
jgi:hypothetical protein